MNGVIFFGHGARDKRWREPFDLLSSMWKNQQKDTLVELAFLELMEPNLDGAVESLIKKGCKDIKIVPVFFGQGGHLRNDFPVLLDACKNRFPEIHLSRTPAVGEDLGVLQSIIEFANRSLV
jgi:sirohydrochlorin cobaltochelatase